MNPSTTLARCASRSPRLDPPTAPRWCGARESASWRLHLGPPVQHRLAGAAVTTATSAKATGMGADGLCGHLDGVQALISHDGFGDVGAELLDQVAWLTGDDAVHEQGERAVVEGVGEVVGSAAVIRSNHTVTSMMKSWPSRRSCSEHAVVPADGQSTQFDPVSHRSLFRRSGSTSPRRCDGTTASRLAATSWTRTPHPWRLRRVPIPRRSPSPDRRGRSSPSTASSEPGNRLRDARQSTGNPGRSASGGRAASPSCVRRSSRSPVRDRG